jgi:hypothetical protein
MSTARKKTEFRKGWLHPEHMEQDLDKLVELP